MMREYGKETGLDLEPIARICERHTGAGLTIDDIRRQALPLPLKDLLPETVEEKLVWPISFIPSHRPKKRSLLRRLRHQ